LLDNPTLNDERREKRKRVLGVMTRFCNGEAGFDAARVLAELAPTKSHRAIVRDLILTAEEDLDPWSDLVLETMQRIPGLKAWALSPIARRVAVVPSTL
jgi:hypothetical protein